MLDRRFAADSGDTAVDVDEAWLELRPHFELASGFWLAFVFTDQLEAADTLVRRAQSTLAEQGRSQRVHRPADADELRELASVVGRGTAPHLGAEWVVGPTLALEAWNQLILALNRRRDAIRRSLSGALLLVAPQAMKPRVRELAIDLWSVRTVAVDCVWHEPPVPLARGTEPVESSEPSAPQVEELRRLLVGRRAAEAYRSGTQLIRECDKAGAGARTLAELRLLTARAAIGEGDTAAAIDLLEQAIQLAPDSRLRLEALITLRDAAVTVDRLELARTAAQEIVAELRRGDDADALSAALGALVTLELAFGSVTPVELADEEVAVDRARLESSETKERMCDLAVALRHAGDARRAAGEYANAFEAYRETLDIQKQLVDKYGSTAARLEEMAVTFGRVGDLLGDVGDVEGAAGVFAQALGAERSLIEHFGETPDRLRSLSVAVGRLGDARRAAGQIDGAAEAYAETLSLQRRVLATSGDTAQGLTDLAATLARVGAVRAAQGDDAAASEAYDEALALHRRVQETWGESPDRLHELSRALVRVGDARRVRRDVAAADAYEEAVSLGQRLLDSYGMTPERLYDVALALSRLGEVRCESGDLGPAFREFDGALAVNRYRLERYGETADRLRDVAQSLYRLGELYRITGDPVRAAAAIDEAFRLTRRAIELSGETPDLLRGLSMSLDAAGRLALDRGDAAGAVAASDEALAIDRRRYDADASDPRALADLRAAHEVAIAAHRAAGDAETAKELEAALGELDPPPA